MPQSFRDIASVLRISYRSGSDDLVGGFYGPCLECSVLYRRAVGYFTSSGLARAARGVAQLVESGGKMRLVASPNLEERDVEALRLGVEQPGEILRRVAARNLEEIENLLTKERLSALAWLIAKGSLEVRLAVRLGVDGEPSRGIYHEKMGIFTDCQANHIAFSGSSNETTGGLVDNFESIDVYWSWDDAHGRVQRKLKDFEDLWENRTPSLRIFEFTDISKDLLRQYKLPAAPIVSEKSPEYGVSGLRDLRDYQRAALEKWKAAGGRGILAMATGTGKTLTALHLVRRMSAGIKPLVVIVLVPYVNLALQWEVAMRGLQLEAIRCFESRQSWEALLQQQVNAAEIGARDLLVALVTNRSFLSQAFQRHLCPERIPYFLIADEVHNLGANEIKKKLDSRIPYRLGLSATPERHQDVEGTKAIFEYFGDVVFEFGIEEAIQQGYLCRYFYYPVLVDLNELEATEYWDLSIQISQRWPKSEDDPLEDHLKMLLLRRARLLASAASKLPKLRDVIDHLKEPVAKAIVYCGDGRAESQAHDKIVRQVDAACELLGNACHLRLRRFTCDEPAEERQRILNGLRRGTLDAVVAIRCLDEGIDVPDIRQAFVLASSTNPRQFIQRRGRLLRPAPGKDFAHIWDFIVSPPDLGGQIDDQSFNVERRLFQRELRRVIEFCATAENGPSALAELRDLRRRYQLLNL